MLSAGFALPQAGPAVGATRFAQRRCGGAGRGDALARPSRLELLLGCLRLEGGVEVLEIGDFQLRLVLIDAIDEERSPSADALAMVNAALATRETSVLVPGADGSLRLERRREGAPIDRALAELARRVAAEVGEGRPERFRVCGNDRCRWVFYDRSRPGSRRWCEMSSCGNRMKAARHRARAKEKAAAEPARP